MSTEVSIRRNRLVLRTIAVGAACLFILFSIRSAHVPTHGFAAYYTFSRELLDGRDFSMTYDYPYFNKLISEEGFRDIKDFPNNIPTNALMLLPISWLPPASAKIAWTAISFLFLLGGIRILLLTYDIPVSGDAGTAFVALIFLWRPVYETVALGQAYLLLFFIFCLCLLAISRRRSFRSSLPVAVGLMVKGYGLLLLLWFFLSKRWKEGVSTIAFVALIFLATLPWFGLNSWAMFDQKVVRTLGTLPSDAHVAFQTINGFVNHLLTRDEQWSVSPLITLPKQAAMAVSYLLNGSLIAWILRRCIQHGNRNPVLAGSALIGAGVITAPLAEEYHFVLFLPLVIGLLRGALTAVERLGRVRPADVLFLVSVIVMALPLPYKSLNFSSPPVAFLAYPKLYAGLVMLSYFSFLLRESDAASAS